MPVLAARLILTISATQVMPNTVVAVLLAPIALSTSANLGLRPEALLMAVAWLF